MSKLELSISLGMGDIIYMAAALNAVKDKYDEININANWELADVYKNNHKYADFSYELMKKVFDKKININKEGKYKLIAMTDGLNPNIIPTLPRFLKQLSGEQKPLTGNYIVITTKVRQLNKNIYNNVKSQFLDTIKELSNKYNIVILGEREVEINYEYSQYNNKNIYSIYNDIKSNIKNNVIDLTIPKLGIQIPTFDKLEKDCAIMGGARSVITFGCGGNFALALSTAQNVIGLRSDNYTFVDSIIKQHDNMEITFNIINFLSSLKSL